MRSAVKAFSRSELGSQLGRFAVVGVASTLLSLVLFVLFAQITTHQWANALSLIISTIANTAVNRRFTFGVNGRDGAARVQLQSLLLLGVTWGLTAFALWLLGELAPDASTTLAAATFMIGNAVATIVRFVLLRKWFGSTPSVAPGHEQAETAVESLPMSAHWEPDTH